MFKHWKLDKYEYMRKCKQCNETKYANSYYSAGRTCRDCISINNYNKHQAKKALRGKKALPPKVKDKSVSPIPTIRRRKMVATLELVASNVKQNLKVSPTGLAHIKATNECYLDATKHHRIKGKVIGYNTPCPNLEDLVSEDEEYITQKSKFPITKDMADQLLLDYLKEIEDIVNHDSKGYLRQCQFDGLVSFVYRIGIQYYKVHIIRMMIKKLMLGTAVEQMPKMYKAVADYTLKMDNTLKYIKLDMELFSS